MYGSLGLISFGTNCTRVTVPHLLLSQSTCVVNSNSAAQGFLSQVESGQKLPLFTYGKQINKYRTVKLVVLCCCCGKSILSVKVSFRF